MKFKDSVLQQYYFVGKVLVNKVSANWRYVCINDLEEYSDGDMFEFNNDLYILIGSNLVKMNSSIAIPADIELIDKIHRVNLIDYFKEKVCLESLNINGSEEIGDNIESLDNLLDRLLSIAYTSFVVNEAGTIASRIYSESSDSFDSELGPWEFSSALFRTKKIDVIFNEYDYYHGKSDLYKTSLFKLLKERKPVVYLEDIFNNDNNEKDISLEKNNNYNDSEYVKLKEEIINFVKNSDFIITYDDLADIIKKYPNFYIDQYGDDLYNFLNDNNIEVMEDADKIIKLQDNDERKKNEQEMISESPKYELFSRLADELFEKYEKDYGQAEEVINRIKKNGNVLKQLKSGVSVLNSFIVNDCIINVKELFEYNFIEYKSKVYRSDYSFLIINFIKAVEIFFAYKLSKFNGKIVINVKKEIDGEVVYPQENVELNSVEFKKNALLSKMIYYVLNNQDQTIDHNIDKMQKDRFIKELILFKDNDRNGYFHKDSISSINDALNIIVDSLQLLVGIEMYIKNGDELSEKMVG